MSFLLPKTLSNTLFEPITFPITSLDEYVKPLDSLQHYYVSLEELLPMYGIPEGKTLIVGEEPKGVYSIILDTTILTLFLTSLLINLNIDSL